MDVKQELTVSGKFENLAKISEFIERMAGQARLDDKAGYAMQMAVDEACTNIIEHAYGGESTNPIRLIAEVEQTGLTITIYDQGRPFEPSQAPPLDTQAPLEKRGPGGMGLFFIHQLLDQVEFETGLAAGNRLRLFKRRRPA